MLFLTSILLLVPAVWSQSTSTSYRVEPTLASWATIGVAQTPTVSNPNAILAQNVCPGYTLSKVVESSRGLTGQLTLAGRPCDVYGGDYTNLTLSVYFDTETRLHVTIEDTAQVQYRIPPSLINVPPPASTVGSLTYNFSYNESPFEFWVTRIDDGEILFDTRGYKLVFETQYLELTTNLEENYNIYGLGEVIHALRLGNNFTRTMWAKYVSCQALLISVMRLIPLMRIYMDLIPSTSNTSILTARLDEIIQRTPFIYEAQMAWIS